MLYAFSLTKILKNILYFLYFYYIYEEVDIIKDLIPIKKACKQIGISYKTLYNWVNNNIISYTKIGSRYYLSQEQLNALVFVYSKDLTQATK